MPLENNRAPVEAALDNHLHYRNKIAIIEKLALAARKAKDQKLAISLLTKAIEHSPLSPHLYDSLVRIYGEFKLYDKIVPLLTKGNQNVESAIKAHNSAQPGEKGRKRLAQLERLKLGFASRIENAPKRKGKAERKKERRSKVVLRTIS